MTCKTLLFLLLLLLPVSLNVFSQEWPVMVNDFDFTFANHAVPFKKDGKFGLIEPNSTILLTPRYDTIFKSGGWQFAKQDGENFLIDFKGNPLNEYRFKSITQQEDWLYVTTSDSKPAYLPKFFRAPFRPYATIEELKKAKDESQGHPINQMAISKESDLVLQETGYHMAVLQGKDKSLEFRNATEIRGAEGYIIVYYEDKRVEVTDLSDFKTILKTNNIRINDVTKLEGKLFYIGEIVENGSITLGLFSQDNTLIKKCPNDSELFSNWLISRTSPISSYHLTSGKETTFPKGYDILNFKTLLGLRDRDSTYIYNQKMEKINTISAVSFAGTQSAGDYTLLYNVAAPETTHPEIYKPKLTQEKHPKEFPLYYAEEHQISTLYNNAGNRVMTFYGRLTQLIGDNNTSVFILTDNNKKCYLHIDLTSKKVSELNYNYMISHSDNYIVQQGAAYRLVNKNYATISDTNYTEVVNYSKRGYTLMAELSTSAAKAYFNADGEKVTIPAGKFKVVRISDDSDNRHYMFIQEAGKKHILNSKGTLLYTAQEADMLEVKGADMLVISENIAGKRKVTYVKGDGKVLSQF